MKRDEKVESLNFDWRGISGLILGIVGVSFSFVVPLSAVLISIPGLVFSFLQQKIQKTKVGLAGLILNFISLSISITVFIWAYNLIQKLI